MLSSFNFCALFCLLCYLMLTVQSSAVCALFRSLFYILLTLLSPGHCAFSVLYSLATPDMNTLQWCSTRWLHGTRASTIGAIRAGCNRLEQSLFLSAN